MDVGLVMELQPITRSSGESESAQHFLSMVCKYKAPEPLTIQFYYEGKEMKPVKLYNESWMERDGWHGEHVWNATWEPRQVGIVECHTITRTGLTLGMLTGRLPSQDIATGLQKCSLQGFTKFVVLQTNVRWYYVVFYSYVLYSCTFWSLSFPFGIS